MTEHYFSADPGVPFERESFTAELWGSTLTIDTGSGVFSRGHLDHATAVLFKELEPASTASRRGSAPRPAGGSARSTSS